MMSTDPSLVPPGTLPTTFIPTTSAGNVGYMVMSYPGRPQMVPGIPMPPGMGMPYMQLGAPPPLMPGVMPMGPPMMGAPPMPTMPGPAQVRAYRPAHLTTPATVTARPKIIPPIRYLPPQPDGPAVTVFVGNITEKAPDQMVRYILAACGNVTSWKRVSGFGFCEFGNPDAGLRAIRILHSYEICNKKLVVKVDAKTKTILDEYKNEKRKKSGSSSPLQDENTDEDDYMDEDMKKIDRAALDRISMILLDYEQEMKSYVPTPFDDHTKPVITEIKLPTTPTIRQDQQSVDLTDANIEDDRRDLITREIGKFREIMKKQEEEKEVERKKREEKERERGTRERSPSSISSRDRGKSHDRSSTPDSRRHHKSRHRSKSRSRDRERDREREKERERDRENERTRERDRDREREREKERDAKSDKDILREKEEEEEAKERKKQDRKAREKEASYQERLRAWESRERHKVKEVTKEKEKKRQKEEEREKEAKRLKEFLEDYDDERDDLKGRELARKLEEREKEMELEAKDRQKEKEELAELKVKIFSGDSEDPSAEFAKALKAQEEMYKPKIIINVAEPLNKHPEKDEKNKEKREKNKDREKDREKEIEKEILIKDKEKDHEKENDEIHIDDKKNLPVERPDSSPDDHFQDSMPDPPSNHSSPEPNIEKPHVKPHSPPPDKKKKKLDLKEVFNNDEDEEVVMGGKKRKLVPLDYGDDKKKVKEQEKKEDQAKSQEEKRKHIKSLIDRIPTDKGALFAYILDWTAVDNQLMEKRIRPWINKKIIEYIGEPEPTLVDFICSKVMAGSAPQGILDDVQMVLDEEAEVFVVKMWRLLIYEIEAKKLGLVK